MTARELHRTIVVSLVVLSVLAGRGGADELRTETSRTWDSYIAATKARMEDRLSTKEPFLWIDEDPERARRVRAGEILVVPAGKPNPLAVPHGLIHHWMGAVFLPHATLDHALDVLNNYDRYEEYFTPNIARSWTLTDAGDEQRFAMVLVAKEFGVTAAVETEMDARVTRIDATRAYRYFSTSRVQAIEHFGKADEHMDDVDSGPGYVWRLAMGWRMAERDGGVFVETETLAMSRGIPFEVRWLIAPLTGRLPRELITHILQATREVLAQDVGPKQR